MTEPDAIILFSLPTLPNGLFRPAMKALLFENRGSSLVTSPTQLVN